MPSRKTKASHWAGRKIAQIGQIEPVGVTRRRMFIRREVKFVRNTRHYKKGIRQMTNSFINFLCYFDFIVLIKRLNYAFYLPCVVCAFCYSLFIY